MSKTIFSVNLNSKVLDKRTSNISVIKFILENKDVAFGDLSEVTLLQQSLDFIKISKKIDSINRFNEGIEE